MKVDGSRITDGKLVLTGEGRVFCLPDGVYRRPDGESITIRGEVIVAAVPQRKVEPPPQPIDVARASPKALTQYTEEIDEQLSTIGDDAQLANIDLQNMLQKQQQTMQMMSNLSKILHDTALAVIRKLG